MPLGTNLQSDLESWFETGAGDFVSAGLGLSGPVGSFFATFVQASLTVSASEATLAASLASAFAAPAGAGAALDIAFQAFAVTVGAGMLPAFVATPPPSPPGFTSATAGPHPLTHAIAAATYAALIDVWARTGTAVPSGGGPVVPWS